MYLLPIVAYEYAVQYTFSGWKKEKHVKKSLIAALIPVAGLAAMANAQAPTPTTIENGWVQYQTNFGIMQIRFAVDGDGRNAQASNPIAASLTTLTPGPGATSVGLTLQARFQITGTNTRIPSSVINGRNFGLGRVSFSNTTTYNSISHNDAIPNGRTDRGQTTVAQSDTFGGTTLNYGLFGATREFRNAIGAFGGSRGNSSNWNAGQGNAVAGQNIFPDNVSVVGGASGVNTTVAASLAGSSRVRVNNGFQSASGTTISAFDAQLTGIAALAPFLNDGLGFQTGFSNWENFYRVVFVPRANTSDLPRDVTVSFNGNVQYLAGYSDPTGQGTSSAGIAYAFLANAGLYGASQNPSTPIDGLASVTFQVPTPGAAALLGLGGLAAFRRRR